MNKPKIGDKVRIIGEQTDNIGDTGTVAAVYDTIEEWWDTPTGESKVALMDALDEYGPEKAATAEWYIEVTLDEEQTGYSDLALASFEVEPI